MDFVGFPEKTLKMKCRLVQFERKLMLFCRVLLFSYQNIGLLEEIIILNLLLAKIFT